MRRSILRHSRTKTAPADLEHVSRLLPLGSRDSGVRALVGVDAFDGRGKHVGRFEPISNGRLVAADGELLGVFRPGRHPAPATVIGPDAQHLATVWSSRPGKITTGRALSAKVVEFTVVNTDVRTLVLARIARGLTELARSARNQEGTG